MPPKRAWKICTGDRCEIRGYGSKKLCEDALATPGDVCKIPKQSGGGNRWINHVKDFAQRNDMTYSEALKSPACKREYYQ